MVLAVDVFYKEAHAKAVGVLFEIEDEVLIDTIVDISAIPREYVPGEFYKRELPCILKIVDQCRDRNLELIIIDGYVYVDNGYRKGLGAHLYDKLEHKIPVIDVAKNPFHSNTTSAVELQRGLGKKPLYVTAVGMELVDAVEIVKHMKGEYRMPTLLRELDKLTKSKN